MEILDLKTAIVLYVSNKNFQVAVEHKDIPERLKWRKTGKDSNNNISSYINNGENSIHIFNHDINNEARYLFFSSYIIGFPKTYRKIIIKNLFLRKDFWSEYTYMTAFNSLKCIIKYKYDYQKSN